MRLCGQCEAACTSAGPARANLLKPPSMLLAEPERVLPANLPQAWQTDRAARPDAATTSLRVGAPFNGYRAGPARRPPAVSAPAKRAARPVAVGQGATRPALSRPLASLHCSFANVQQNAALVGVGTMRRFSGRSKPSRGRAQSTPVPTMSQPAWWCRARRRVAERSGRPSLSFVRVPVAGLGVGNA